MELIGLKDLEYVKTRWEGGTSTQLLILPVNASYAQRNFQIRISKATIKGGESNFTLLPGIKRNLVLLEGAVLLSLKGKGKRLMLPGDEMNFSGNQEISSLGKATDFNVMMQGKGRASTQLLNLAKEESVSVDMSTAGQLVFFHVHMGSVKIKVGTKTILLGSNQSFYIPKFTAQTAIELYANKASTIVLAEVLMELS
ncbi:MAG: hypothetical protein CFE21_09660 [Bacteroidetes bacterium B1(2017)]|nr:MAG: hypothetical protein CFE21_09660 [Bacteroidetes bacterium B1(2017)]